MTVKDLLRLIRLQGFRCAISGVPITPRTAALDHKIPCARGGKHELSNLHWVSKSVNKAKSTMTVEEFAEMCNSVSQHLSTDVATTVVDTLYQRIDGSLNDGRTSSR